VTLFCQGLDCIDDVSFQAIVADKVSERLSLTLAHRLRIGLQFQAENVDGHSSSIVDLFDSLRSPIAFLQELEWSDEYQNARFSTGLSKVGSLHFGKKHLLTTTLSPSPKRSSNTVVA